MSRYKRAKRNLAIRTWIHSQFESVFTWGTELIYGPDGFKKHGPTHLIAELFFIDCPVCLWWRGFIVGAVLPAILIVFLSIVVWL